jgi:hypothetical protein
MTPARYALSFLVIMLSIGINVGQHLLDEIHIDRNALLIALIAIVVAGLLAHRHLLFIALIAALTVAINLPPELLAQRNISQDVLLATLLAVTISPFFIKLLH